MARCADARLVALTMRRTPEDHMQLGRFLEPAVTALGAVVSTLLVAAAPGSRSRRPLELVT